MFRRIVIGCATLSLGLLAGCGQTAPEQAAQRLGHPTNGAEAWKIANDAISPAADTVAAIDSAKRLTLFNTTHADTNGYRALRCEIVKAKTTISIDMTPGRMERTERQLDVAIAGSGFFRLKVDPNTGDGYAYTRNGNFFLNNNGEMVIGQGDGFRLDPPITVPSDVTQTNISNQGVVSVLRAGQITRQIVGQINLYQFANPSGLMMNDDNLLIDSDFAGQAIESKPDENGAGILLQNYLERSDVNLAAEEQRMKYLDEWRALLMR